MGVKEIEHLDLMQGWYFLRHDINISRVTYSFVNLSLDAEALKGPRARLVHVTNTVENTAHVGFQPALNSLGRNTRATFFESRMKHGRRCCCRV